MTSAPFGRGALAAAAFLLCPMVALAGGTRIWELAGAEELGKGEPRETAVSDAGEVALGDRARQLDVADTGLVWSAVDAGGDTAYLGTGYDGRILRVRGDDVDVIATTGQLVITALALGSDGYLYAASLPDAAIWRVKDPGKVLRGKPVEAERFAALPEQVKHVLALVFDAKGRTLFAGTGPDGEIHAIGPDGKTSVWLETGEEHVVALVRRGEKILAGTSPGALLLEVSGPGRALALADFDATEVKAIAVDGDALVVAVNKFKVKPTVPVTSPLAAPQTGGKTTSSAPQKGSGSLHRILADGRQEDLWSHAERHVLCLARDGKGVVHAGLGVEGLVVSVDPERRTRIALDLDERQVMALLARDGLWLAATGDAGAAYRVNAGRPAEASYLSPVLDAGAPARFGRVDWFGQGTLEVRARSGQTSEPDGRWGDWSGPIARGAAVPDPSARYLQLRFDWSRDAAAVLRAAEVAYRPLNRRALVTELDPGSPFTGKGKPAAGKEKGKEKGVKSSTRTIPARPEKRNESLAKISWKVDNPDEDELRYRLWYRAVGQDLWRPITREDEVLTKTRYDWDTGSVPEGRYQLRLVADDSPSNDPEDVLFDEWISEPLIVDNQPPAVRGLAYRQGAVSGKAEDGFSSISWIELSVDGGPWLPLFPRDGVLDGTREEFGAKLAEPLGAGPHALAVRAWDRAGNVGTAEVHVDLP
ncbi:MAG TPA: hypothetical protein VM285_05865 [Polyangia bacterium]|nr:hypothetical protein [Polyangia bacterium]